MLRRGIIRLARILRRCRRRGRRLGRVRGGALELLLRQARNYINNRVKNARNAAVKWARIAGEAKRCGQVGKIRIFRGQRVPHAGRKLMGEEGNETSGHGAELRVDALRGSRSVVQLGKISVDHAVAVQQRGLL